MTGGVRHDVGGEARGDEDEDEEDGRCFANGDLGDDEEPGCEDSDLLFLLLPLAKTY